MSEDGRTEGTPRVVDERHLGGFAIRMDLSRKDGAFDVQFKANKYEGDSPTQEQLEALAKKETGCEDTETHAVDIFFGFKELRYNCSKGQKKAPGA